MQSLLDLLLTVHHISYAFLVIVREAPVPLVSTCQPVSKPKKTLNKKLREPEKLVLYKHGLYECTMNDPQGRYNQSSLALLMDLPQGQTVVSILPITMWIAPAGTTDLDFASFCNGQPMSGQLKDLEWVQVKIGCAPEQIVVLCGGAHAKRMQYALKH